MIRRDADKSLEELIEEMDAALGRIGDIHDQIGMDLDDLEQELMGFRARCAEFLEVSHGRHNKAAE